MPCLAAPFLRNERKRNHRRRRTREGLSPSGCVRFRFDSGVARDWSMRVRAGCEYSLTRALRLSLPHACFHCTAVASWAEVMLCEKGSRAEAVGCSAASRQALCECIEDRSHTLGDPSSLKISSIWCSSDLPAICALAASLRWALARGWPGVEALTSGACLSSSPKTQPTCGFESMRAAASRE